MSIVFSVFSVLEVFYVYLLMYVHLKHIIKITNLLEWLRERTEHIDIFLFSAHHWMVFYFRCSVYWWKWSVRF